MQKPKLVIGISGASGSIYAQLLLKTLDTMYNQFENISIVMSNNAKTVWQTELNNLDYLNYRFKLYDVQDFNAPFASGSANFDTMIIIPCSMGTLAKIATGISNDLLTRAADVMLKEKRKLILVVREAPYNLIHLKNMETITLSGGIICPASPSFYSKPNTIETLALTVVHRALSLSNIHIENRFTWGQ
ncbi:MAG: UbiX family flavin prenyltransferase [Sediminibacterium sp.]|nr:UbiX family flavin prenyltransferase [Sediminibacterium sp.]